MMMMKRPRNSQSCDENFAHVNSPSGFARIFIPHENIHATHEITLSMEELGTISKNNLRVSTLEMRPI